MTGLWEMPYQGCWAFGPCPHHGCWRGSCLSQPGYFGGLTVVNEGNYRLWESMLSYESWNPLVLLLSADRPFSVKRNPLTRPLSFSVTPRLRPSANSRSNRGLCLFLAKPIFAWVGTLVRVQSPCLYQCTSFPPRVCVCHLEYLPVAVRGISRLDWVPSNPHFPKLPH